MRVMFKETKQKCARDQRGPRKNRDAKDRQNTNQTKTNNEHILSFTVGLRLKKKTRNHILLEQISVIDYSQVKSTQEPSLGRVATSWHICRCQFALCLYTQKCVSNQDLNKASALWKKIKVPQRTVLAR